VIVVTGATGRLGSAVVRHLLNRVSAAEVVACVRNPDAAKELVARGVIVRVGDYDDPDSLLKAFAGADRLLLVSASGIAYQSRVSKHRTAIDAAQRAGVGHIYYTSLIPGDDSVAHVQKAHTATELYLKESSLRSQGLRYTILRDGAYAEAWDLYLGDVSGGVASVPADGPVSWVSRDDLGEGIAELLYRGGQEGQALELTGPAALTLAETAATLGRVRNRPIAVRIIPYGEFISLEVARGKSREQAERWGTTYQGLARGEFGKASPTLGGILGRPPRSFQEVASTWGRRP
jgi:uncharacterized protein YbjT (DUF2867 family)